MTVEHKQRSENASFPEQDWILGYIISDLQQNTFFLQKKRLFLEINKMKFFSRTHWITIRLVFSFYTNSSDYLISFSLFLVE